MVCDLKQINKQKGHFMIAISQSHASMKRSMLNYLQKRFMLCIYNIHFH